ncbi:unnamed protein product [Discula destructiva]
MAETQAAPMAAETTATATAPPNGNTTTNATAGAAAETAAATPAPAQFPGDNILPDADTVYDQRKTINAPAEDVWPWLVQWGKGRGGWYVPSKFEKALPEKYRSAPTIDPKWQDLKVGDKVPDYGLGKKTKKGDAAVEYHLEVAALDNQRALVYKGERLGQDFTWALLLESPSGAAAGTTGSSADSTASAAECVLHLRFRGKSQQTGWKAKVTQQLGKVADGMMASAMFPGIADRVELQQKRATATA